MEFGEVEDYLLPITPPTPTCECECDPPFTSGDDLVENGDFSAGNVGFTSDLTFTDSPSAGHYCITNNAALASPAYWVGFDHTSPPTGLFLVCNGNTIPLLNGAWKQNITPVTQYTNYKFCFWVLNLNKIDYPGTFEPEIQPMINSVPITSFTVDRTTTVSTSYTAPKDEMWHFIEVNWFSGANTFANLEIWTLVPAGRGGTDFGIDDICFVECISDIIQCQCEILKVHITGTPVEEGDRIDIPGASVFLPVSRDFDVTANCGDCSLTSYEWTITKSGSPIYTNSTSAFTYSFINNGLYTFEIIITCSDGSTCSRTFTVNIDAAGGTVTPTPIDPIK